MRRFIALGVLALASLFIAAAQGAPAATGDFIVVLKEGGLSPAAAATTHGRAFGFNARHVYTHALHGYAATIPQAALPALSARPEVDFVFPDGELRLQTDAPPQPPFPGEDIPVQRVSFCVLRIDGDESSTRSGDGRGEVNINVAVIDDGPIDVDHPDLNVVGSTSCLNGRDGNQENPNLPIPGTHSTMVAGFIGARDNAFGRVGVAPGARIWAVEAFDDRGSATDSELICALDWVTATRTDADPSNDILVANLSASGHVASARGACGAVNDALLVEVCGLVDTGVTLVAAAGNESTDIRDVAPATYDVVLTASAMADSDGQPGGAGPPFQCLPEQTTEDSAAYFSNFATLAEDKVHTIAAPGVCIGSTYPGGLYAISSGTSFATPLVSGTVALCIAAGRCAGLTPRQIIQTIVGDAAAHNTAKKNAGYGFQGDPLRPIAGKYYGYLIRAGLY
jgi:subtilisin family serine protease